MDVPRCRLGLLLCVLLLNSASAPAATVLSGVPAYNWYHGCGPTAAGSILGYWDLQGYSNLFTAEGWSAVSLTASVRDQISSPQHNARYDSTPDTLSQPQSWNSIADWFHTSEDPQQFGWSSLAYAASAFEGYAAYRGYTFEAWTAAWASVTWERFVAEIDAGNPLLFLVDWNGDGATDHFIPVIGYDDQGSNGLWYAFYDTWSEEETVQWMPYVMMAPDTHWGVATITFVEPLAVSVPEPSSLGLGGLLALAGVVFRVHRKRTTARPPC